MPEEERDCNCRACFALKEMRELQDKVCLEARQPTNEEIDRMAELCVIMLENGKYY